MTERVIFHCPFCGSGTRPTHIERKRVGAKCESCNKIHFYNYSDTEMAWFYEHSEEPQGSKGGKK